MTIAPALTAKAPGTTSVSGQKRSKKHRAGDLFSDVVGLEPTGDNEHVPLQAKKGKTSLKSDKQATGHNPEMPHRPVKMVRAQGIQCTGMFTHNI